MVAPIIVTALGKTFRRYHPGRPRGIHEALAQGVRWLRPVERFWGLRNVSFTVGAGRVAGVIGANGSGKSTLLRLVGGVGRPDTGQVAIRGRIGALLDLGAGFHPDLTGRENVLLAGILNGLTRRQVLERFDSIVAFAEVAPFIDNPLRTYSTGMAMRLAFATAVHTEPDILLIDEVLSVGDVAFQRKCRQRIVDFKTAGCTILLVSHSASLMQDLCDEVLWLNAGRLQAQGAAKDVLGQYLAHMRDAGEPAAEDAAHGHVRLPPGSAPQPTVRTERGAELVLEESHFGSVELRITAVRILDTKGNAVSGLPSGQPMRLEISYSAPARVDAPLFRVRIFRTDGLLCCDLTSEVSAVSLSTIQGHGRIVMTIDRLDLNTAHYVIDVGCYAQDWAYAYDYRSSVSSFKVLGDSDSASVLNAPHRWELEETNTDADAVVHAVTDP